VVEFVKLKVRTLSLLLSNGKWLKSRQSDWDLARELCGGQEWSDHIIAKELSIHKPKMPKDFVGLCKGAAKGFFRSNLYTLGAVIYLDDIHRQNSNKQSETEQHAEL
jgi:hypothetical protein